MEGEVFYSTVVFNRYDDAKPKAAGPAEEVVYSDIKMNRDAPSQSIPEPAADAAASRAASYRWATACLGLLCVLLLAGVVAMSVMNITQVSQYSAVLALHTNETTAHWKVRAEKAALEKENAELVAQRDQLNTALRFITQFSSFPVRAFCQSNNGEMYCGPCRKNWIQNGSSCYLFHTGLNWRTWAESQQYCTEQGGDLVTVDNIEEQEFIRQNTPSYYDKYHGYWIGLNKKNGIWAWTSGTALKNGFWIDPPKQSDDSCVLTKPSSNAQKSWEPNYCNMYNKWICEMRALEWPRKTYTANN
ncbi:asialoglycoprotein receptor 2 [Colossoma macropomum]|uniref:asialoglycoprotein receptor 2 n=1 Tax=Colossoma macropomum TaxID=42526 RepID=UPI001864BD8B|nr:asialoglycoprotein receptor 2 [Colossoma macropomum]